MHACIYTYRLVYRPGGNQLAMQQETKKSLSAKTQAEVKTPQTMAKINYCLALEFNDEWIFILFYMILF